MIKDYKYFQKTHNDFVDASLDFAKITKTPNSKTHIIIKNLAIAHNMVFIELGGKIGGLWVRQLELAEFKEVLKEKLEKIK